MTKSARIHTSLLNLPNALVSSLGSQSANNSNSPVISKRNSLHTTNSHSESKQSDQEKEKSHETGDEGASISIGLADSSGILLIHSLSHSLSH
jgi:hypothetical protein